MRRVKIASPEACSEGFFSGPAELASEIASGGGGRRRRGGSDESLSHFATDAAAGVKRWWSSLDDNSLTESHLCTVLSSMVVLQFRLTKQFQSNAFNFENITNAGRVITTWVGEPNIKLPH